MGAKRDFLVGVVMVATLAVSLRSRQIPASVADRFSLDRVYPGMSRAVALSLLGRPDASGTLRVKGGMGSYLEYGHDRLTWEGHPTVVFGPSGEALSVVGDVALRSGEKLFCLGDSADLVNSTMRPVAPVVTGREETRIYHTTSGTLHLSCHDGRVSRMILEKV
jgi:hypothetical protein